MPSGTPHIEPRELMANEDRREMAHTDTSLGVANRGLMRPPLLYLSAIALGLLLQFAWPVRLAPPVVSAPLGGAAALVAVTLFLSAVRTFRTAGTPVPGTRPTTTIVRTGPYRWSRNPIYLSFSLLQLGVACWINSLWLLVTLIPTVALMSLVIIPREERYLERRFPSEYLPYKAAVRRWL
jgi:protein-S-isoprenylcysteine O-methyltransferase Ste14